MSVAIKVIATAVAASEVEEREDSAAAGAITEVIEVTEEDSAAAAMGIVRTEVTEAVRGPLKRTSRSEEEKTESLKALLII